MLPTLHRLRSTCALLTTLVLVPACGGSDSGGTTPPDGPEPVTRVEVTPTSLTLTVGETGQLSAQPQNASGSPLSGRTVTWTSSNDAVATVTSSGSVTAVSAGSATISATSEGRSGTASVTVNAIPVASIDLQPTDATVEVGATAQLTARTLDASGNELSDRTVAWSSSDEAVATVSSSGVVTGEAPGTATITAESEGVSATASITVERREVGLTLEESTGTPFATRVVTFPEIVGETDDEFAGTIGESDVTFVLTDSVTAAFSVPDAEAGAVRIRIPLGTDRIGVGDFELLPAPVVDANAVSTEALEALDAVTAALNFEQSLGALGATGVTAADLDAAEAEIADLRALVAGASEAELRAIALTIEGNPDLFQSARATADAVGEASSSQVVYVGRLSMNTQLSRSNTEVVRILGQAMDVDRTCRTRGLDPEVVATLRAGCQARLLSIQQYGTVNLNKASTVFPFLDLEGAVADSVVADETIELTPAPRLWPIVFSCDGACPGDRPEVYPDPGLVASGWTNYAEVLRLIDRVRARFDFEPLEALTASVVPDPITFLRPTGVWTAELANGSEGCTFSQGAAGVRAVCENETSQARTVTVDVTATDWPWRYRPGDETQRYEITVLPKSDPTLVVVENAMAREPAGFLLNDPMRVGCFRTLRVKAVGGDIRVTGLRFTSTDAEGRSVTIEPQVSSIPYVIEQDQESTILDEAFFFYFLEGGELPQFGTVYEVIYEEVATGNEETVTAEWACDGTDYLEVVQSTQVGSTFDAEGDSWLRCYQDMFVRANGSKDIFASGANIFMTSSDGRTFEVNVTFTGSTVVPFQRTPAGETRQLLDNAQFSFPFAGIPEPHFVDVRYTIDYVRDPEGEAFPFKVKNEFRCTK